VFERSGRQPRRRDPFGLDRGWYRDRVAGDRRARHVPSRGRRKGAESRHDVHGWAAVDGWLLIMCALAPLAEELLWRRSIFTALAGVAARRVRERQAAVFAIVLSSLMFAAWHLLDEDSPATLWERTLLGIVRCLVFWRTDSMLAAVVVHGLYNLGNDRLRDRRCARATDHAPRADGQGRGTDLSGDHLALARVVKRRRRETAARLPTLDCVAPADGRPPSTCEA
jgi:Type II CAAX prenyl endopeptidase Rce1-like